MVGQHSRQNRCFVRTICRIYVYSHLLGRGQRPKIHNEHMAFECGTATAGHGTEKDGHPGPPYRTDSELQPRLCPGTGAAIPEHRRSEFQNFETVSQFRYNITPFKYVANPSHNIYGTTMYDAPRLIE